MKLPDLRGPLPIRVRRRRVDRINSAGIGFRLGVGIRDMGHPSEDNPMRQFIERPLLYNLHDSQYDTTLSSSSCPPLVDSSFEDDGEGEREDVLQSSPRSDNFRDGAGNGGFEADTPIKDS